MSDQKVIVHPSLQRNQKISSIFQRKNSLTNGDLGIWDTLLAIGVLGRDDDLSLLAAGHGQHGLVPSSNDVVVADLEAERVALLLGVVVGVEDGAVSKVSSVEDSN